MPTENNPMKSAIDRRLSALCVPDDMAQRIQAAAQKKRPRVIRFRRPLAVAAVFCLILACSMGVLATTVPSVQNLFAIVGTQISSMLQPIERSCTDNGIEPTVVAAMNANDMVDIYVAVKDLEGSRINERTNLADVQLSGIAMTPMVQMVQFDEKTATATFRIEGVKELQGYTHTSLTDRIEAASWASAALATHGDIFVKGATQPEMITFLNVFRKVGGKFEVTDKGIRFWHPGGDLKPVAIETDVHPGFMTDWQQPLVVALTQANGLSIVHETVYENRFGFTKPLVEMGATIQLYRECLGSLPCRFRQRNYKHSAVIFGPTPLTGRDIDVPDLRGGFSHLIAALAASGPSDVHGISLIDRGYADFRGKLEALGADFY